ncbi:hypothetical protein AAMO2058_000878200, partial [Amorphochlora amoebiformis]
MGWRGIASLLVLSALYGSCIGSGESVGADPTEDTCGEGKTCEFSGEKTHAGETPPLDPEPDGVKSDPNAVLLDGKSMTEYLSLVDSGQMSQEKAEQLMKQYLTVKNKMLGANPSNVQPVQSDISSAGSSQGSKSHSIPHKGKDANIQSDSSPEGDAKKLEKFQKILENFGKKKSRPQFKIKINTQTVEKDKSKRSGASSKGALGSIKPTAQTDTELKPADISVDQKEESVKIQKGIGTRKVQEGASVQSSYLSVLEKFQNTCFKDRGGGWSEYIFSACLFQQVTQKEAKEKGSNYYFTPKSYSLGKWDGYVPCSKFDDLTGGNPGEDLAVHNHFRVCMQYTGGDTCPGDTQRSTLLSVGCGITRTLYAIREPQTCQYAMRLDLPELCPDVTRVVDGLEDRPIRLEGGPIYEWVIFVSFYLSFGASLYFLLAPTIWDYGGAYIFRTFIKPTILALDDKHETPPPSPSPARRNKERKIFNKAPPIMATNVDKNGITEYVLPFGRAYVCIKETHPEPNSNHNQSDLTPGTLLSPTPSSLFSYLILFLSPFLSLFSLSFLSFLSLSLCSLSP